MNPTSSNSSVIQLDTTGRASMWFASGSPLDQFFHEYCHAMTPNWDGRGASAVSEQVVQLAEDLLRLAPLKDLVELNPGRDGSLSFVWESASGNYLYLDVGPNDTVHLFYETETGETWEGLSVASDQRLIREMHRGFAFFHPQRGPDYFAPPPSSNANWLAAAA